MGNGNDLEMDLVFKANAASVEHTVKEIENQIGRLQKRMDQFKGLSKMSIDAKSLEDFRRINNQVVKQGSDVFKGLEAHRQEYMKLLKKGDLEKAYGGMLKGMQALEDKTARGKKGLAKFSDADKDLIRRFQSATSVLIKAHAFRDRSLGSIASRRGKIEGIQLRQAAAIARAKRERAEREDRAEELRLRRQEAQRGRRYRFLTKFRANRYSAGRIEGENDDEFAVRQERRNEHLSREATRAGNGRERARRAGYVYGQKFEHNRMNPNRLKGETDDEFNLRQYNRKRVEDRQASRNGRFDSHVGAWRVIQRAQEKAQNDMWAGLKAQIQIKDRSGRQEAAQLRAEEVARKRRLREHMAFNKNKLSAERHALENNQEYAIRMEKRRIALRRQLHRNGHKAWHYGHRAVHGMSHPFLSSPAFLAEASLTGALVSLTEAIEKASTFDKSVTDLAIRGNMSYRDAESAGNEAQHTALRYGTSAEHLVNIQKEALSRGIGPDLAKEIGPMVLKFGEATGQKPEIAAEHASEFVQQLLSMHQIKGIGGVHQVLNTAAALSNKFGGSEKMTEAFENGLAERGAALGLNPKDTITLAALMNSMGVRSGRLTTSAMGELAQGSPKWADEYQQRLMSNGSTPQDRLFLRSPRMLGYGNMKAMQADAGGKNGIAGIANFLQSFSRIEDESRRNQLEEMLGLGESLRGIIQAFATSPEKLSQAQSLANQRWGDQDGRGDYLTEAQKKQRQSLEYATGVMDSAFESISIGIEKGVKSKVLLPFVTSWQKLGDWSIDHLPKVIDGIIDGFVSGLGYHNFAGKSSIQAMIDDVDHEFGRINWVNVGHEVATFLKGVGEGFRQVAADIRWVYEKLRGVASFFGDGSIESLGKLTVEIGAFALAMHGIAPVLGIFSSVISMMGLLKSALNGYKALVALSEGGGIMALGAGLSSVAIGLTAIATAVDALMAAGALQRFTMPWADKPDAVGKFLWGENKDGSTARPKWVEDLEAFFKAPTKQGAGGADFTRGPHGGLVPRKQSFISGDAGDDWRNLLQKTSYSPSDSGDVAQSAMIDTAEGIIEVRNSVDRVADLLRRATLAPSIEDGGGAGGGSGGGDFSPGAGRPNIRFGHPGAPTGGDMPNMRYGHGGDGKVRSTPGSGNAAEIGPKVSLGKMGAKFAAKAPVIMDGLMKKYGLTREQAAGVVGNLGHESAGFTAYHEGGQESAKGGVGWAQWTGPRRRAFEAWTKAHNLNPTSDEASWRYLTEGDPETAKAILAVKRTNNRHDAVRAFHDSYERSADISHGVIVKQKSWNSRLSYADKAFGMAPSGASVAAEPKPLGTPANPVTVKVDPKTIVKGAASTPADIAGKVYPTGKTGSDPEAGGGDTRSSAGQSADASGGIHYHITNSFHHQVADADQHARAVGKVFASQLENRAHDVDYNTV